MSYLVLARKWRPQKFEEIVGQSFVSKTLKNAIESGRVAHAFLFSGARGVGKTSTARILAKSLNCKDGPTVDPCGVCENCVEISAGNSIDVFEIDGASNRGIDEIRELRENIKYFPSKSKHKIFIVDEVHMLTKEAFNALLKTLEEPPPHAIFIFATTEPHKIPITILSRCQRFDFKKISLRDISAHLARITKAEGMNISEASILRVARAANGSMRDSQSILDQIISYGGNEVSDSEVNDILGVIDQALIYSIVRAIIEKDEHTALNVINSVYDYGYDINQFCYNILEALRDIIALKVSKNPSELIELSDGELRELEELSEKIEVKEVLLSFNILYKAEEEITKSMSLLYHSSHSTLHITSSSFYVKKTL
ncbi:DNA polymerase III subunit gamma/tau [Thermodesulfobacteriota bacterium]